MTLDFAEIMEGRYNQQHALLQELARRFAGELGDYMSYVEVKPVSVDDDGILVLRLVAETDDLVEHLRDTGDL